jgi:signal transduction histidine kinase
VRLLSRRWAVVLFVVITGGPIALLTYSSIQISTGSATTDAQHGAADSAEASAAFIHQRFQDVGAQLDVFADHNLAPAMTAGPGGRPDMGVVGSELGDLTRLQSGVTTAFVTDPRGRLVSSSPARPDLQGPYFTGDDWYQGVTTQDTPFVAGLSPVAARQKLNSVAIATPIHGMANGVTVRVGYLVGLYDTEQIQAFVDDFAAAHGTNLWVIDGAGYVLAGPGLQLGTVTSWPAGDPLVTAALNGTPDTSQSMRGGVANLSASAPVPGFGWAVVADVPMAVALRDAQRLRMMATIIAGVVGLVLLVGLVVGWALVRRAQQAAVLREGMEALARLNEAAGAVHAERGSTALEIIARRARELVGADFSALGVWDAAVARMAPVAHDAAGAVPGAGLGDLAVLLVERCQPARGARRGELGELGLATAEAELWELGPYLSVPLSAGRRVLGCLIVCRKDGSPRFHTVHERQLQQMAQHATSVLEKGRVDAEREAFLDRLRETNEQLQQVSRLKSQFLARMSHELRTPLSAILGFSDLLLEGTSGELTPGQREDVQEIASAGRGLLDVLSDILDLSRIEAGRMRLETRPVRIGSLLGDVASALRPLALSKSLELRLAVVGGDPLVVADPLRIRQVVTNLVSNAVKFTHKGGVTVRLLTTSTEVEISVLDTGIGIPQEELDTVFDEFSQVGSVPRGFGGSGLGLSIARRLVLLHHGTIGVESEVGVGSRFWFRLPVAKDAAPRQLVLAAEEGVAI